MEENKNNNAPMDEDLQEVIIEELSEEEDNKKRLKRRIFNLIYDVLILIGIGCLIYGGYSLYEGYRDSKEAEESHDNLKDNYVTVPTLPVLPDNPNKPNKPNQPSGSEDIEATQVPERPREWYEQIRVDLVGMQTNINPDIVGWIHFENETISYPLLYSEDNAEYQRVRYDLVYSRGGSIFLEETNSWDLSDIRNVIYGHNMKDLSMFGKLKYYNDQKGYYEDHQYFQLLYNGMVYRYQIFSYFTIHQNEVSYINTNFEKGDDRYGEFLQKLVKNSKKDTGVEVDANDKTVTLVTCSTDNKYRLIVSAVLVDQHTMANADGTFPDEPGTDEPGTDEPGIDEPGTDEPGTDEPGTDEPGTDEPGTDEPGTETPGVRPGADNYTFTDVGKTMMATVSVKIRNKPSTEGVRIALLGKHEDVYVESVCNETGWYRVRYGTNRRKIGYVSGKYLTEENLHLKNPVFGGTADAHLKCGDCGAALSADHVLVETTTEAGIIVYVCECGYISETPPEPGTEEPGTGEPGTGEPGTEEPGTEEPGTSEPGTGEPSTEEPGTSEPGTGEPSTEEPGTSEPGTGEPGTEEPGTGESGSSEPSESESETPGDEPSESESQSGSEEPSESESQSASGEPSESESQNVGEEPSESENSLEPTE